MDLIQACKAGLRDDVEHLLLAKEKKSFLKLFNSSGAKRVGGPPELANSTDAFGITPLHWASVNGHSSIVQLLLEHGANVNQTNEVGDTPLHWAALGGHPDIAMVLMKKGAQIDAKNRAGQTPLQVAANERVGKAIEAKLSREQIWDVIAAEAEQEKEKKKKKDGEEKKSKDKKKDWDGSKTLNSPLVQRTFHLTSHRRTSSPHTFVIAVESVDGTCNVCGETFKPQSKLSRCSDCNIVLHVVCATFCRDPCSRRTLLAKDSASCADLPKNFDSPLSELEEPEEYFTMKKSNSLPLDATEEDISQSFKVELKEKRSNSVIDEVETAMCAVEHMIKGDVMWRKSLDQQNERRMSQRIGSNSSTGSGTPSFLDHKEDSQTPSPQQLTVPSVTSPVPPLSPKTPRFESEAQEIIELLRGGAGLSKRISYCWPQVMNACAGNDYEALAKLIAEGADLSIKTENGSTPLMVASAYGHVDIVELLLSQDKRGKTLNLRNIHGNTAMDLALTMKRTAVAERLESFAEQMQKEAEAAPNPSEVPVVVSPKKLADRPKAEFSVQEVVMAMARLVQVVDSEDPSELIPCVTDAVSAVRVVLDQTSAYRNLDIVKSNQVMIHLLSTLVKTVKANELSSVKPVVMLLINELKNSMLLIQNHKRWTE